MKKNVKIGLIAHIFYEDLIDEVLHYAKQIPYPFDLLITCLESNFDQVETAVKKAFPQFRIFIEVVENRGRDVAPFLLKHVEKYHDYKYLCKIHTKKSKHDSKFEDWRSDLYNKLLGSPEQVEGIIQRFEKYPNLGIQYPDYYDKVAPLIDWGANQEIVEKLLDQLEMTCPKKMSNFVAGTMLWFRPEALELLFKVKWKRENFPEEMGQTDFTIMHGIERMLLIIAESQDYSYYRLSAEDYSQVSQLTKSEKSKRTAVIYHYYEHDQTYLDNLVFFLNQGITASADYYIIIAGSCSISLPKKHNITYLYTENKNHDFGGYIEFIKRFDYSKYGYFVFVNSSVRGPFVPNYVDKNWVEIFTDSLEGETHLVGSTINDLSLDFWISEPYMQLYGQSDSLAHVQTTSYALTKKALQYLIDSGFYQVVKKLSKVEIILRYEILLSRLIIQNGWNITALVPIYNQADYRKLPLPFKNDSAAQYGGDVQYKNAFFGKNISPYEVIFIKTNRDLFSDQELHSFTQIHLNN